MSGLKRYYSGWTNYYLGPVVISEKENDNRHCIIDGQQRLTSILLFLIYLNNLQKKLNISESIESLIFSEVRGSKSFNIEVEERIHCLEQLFSNGYYFPKDSDDESTHNITERYNDIADAFPEEIKGSKLPFFLDWLK